MLVNSQHETVLYSAIQEVLTESQFEYYQCPSYVQSGFQIELRLLPSASGAQVNHNWSSTLTSQQHFQTWISQANILRLRCQEMVDRRLSLTRVRWFIESLAEEFICFLMSMHSNNCNHIFSTCCYVIVIVNTALGSMQHSSHAWNTLSIKILTFSLSTTKKETEFIIDIYKTL